MAKTPKQVQVKSFDGGKIFIRVGDTVQWRYDRRSAAMTIKIKDIVTSAGSSDLSRTYIKYMHPAFAWEQSVAANVEFSVVSRAKKAEPKKVVLKKEINDEADKKPKFVQVLAKGGGTMWLSVGEKYNVYFRTPGDKLRYGYMEYSGVQVKEITPKDGTVTVKGASYYQTPVSFETIASPSVTKLDNRFERLFEKAD